MPVSSEYIKDHEGTLLRDTAALIRERTVRFFQKLLNAKLEKFDTVYHPRYQTAARECATWAGPNGRRGCERAQGDGK